VALEFYLEALPTQPGFQSALADIAKDPQALYSLSEYLPSIASAVEQGSIRASYLSNLPTGQVFSLVSSIASEANAVLTADGFEIQKAPKKPGKGKPKDVPDAETMTVTNMETSTSKAGVVETGKAVGLVAAAGAGFLGVVMAL
jgi:hypothetical protein